ncbi:putative dfg5 protein [Cercophora scortea]|uniref:Mannan endo-1,6-alpha-mannosidase n=1 Tax=Cercophora scortea TaxID=314031 RepID=A0AAE0IE72_9PEZI|nr:putative dfg5 protein [Cercophora scortea]
MKINILSASLALLGCVAHTQAALNVDLTSASSIKAAAKLVAANLLTYYHGDEPGGTPGILPGPPPIGDYYWWEGGALWGTMVDYWHFTGDTEYNTKIQDALIFQANMPKNDYMPPNWTASLGNDDQGFWGLSAMLAAETNFQNPPSTEPQWLALAQAVFNTQAARWDMDSCNGGLRWQIPLSNNGYNYKNTITGAIFFNIAARLARYTNNATYAQWAVKAWDWTNAVGYIDNNYNIFDGAHVEDNCTDINPAQFSYTAAIFVQGLGFMYNYTKGTEPRWQTAITGLTKRTLDIFFPDGIMTEASCELSTHVQCTTDMLSFKGYVHRFLSQTTQMAPFISPTIMPILKTSAAGAAKACNPDGTCGFRWNTGSYDGNTGAGQQMNALGALMSLLVEVDPVAATPPVTNSTGGTSVGNPDAGAGTGAFEPEVVPVTTAGRAGAGIITTVVLGSFVGVLGWMMTRSGEGPKWVDPVLRKNPLMR